MADQDTTVSAPVHTKRRRILVRTGLWAFSLAMVALTVFIVSAILGKKTVELKPAPRRLANVETVRVVPQEYHESLLLPARLEADFKAVISSELNGRVTAWQIAEGGPVEQGQVVLVLNDDDLQAGLASLEAELQSSRRSLEIAESDRKAAEVGLRQAEQDAESLELERELAEANQTYAAKDHDRVKKLAGASISSEADLDAAANRLTQATLGVAKSKDAIARALTRVAAARVRVEQTAAAGRLAESKIAEAERQIASQHVTLAKTRITAPFAGRIEKHLSKAGEVITPGQPLTRLYDLRHIRAIVDVADRYVPFLDVANPAVAAYIQQQAPGAEQDVKAHIVIPGLPRLTGKSSQDNALAAEITRISQAAGENSSSFEVELRAPNPGQALKDGMLVQAWLQYLRYPGAIVVPMRAVQVADVGPRVLVVRAENGRMIAEVRDIEPMSIRKEEVLVAGGIAPGDLLVVAGGKGVLHGEEVNVIVADGVVQAAAEARPATSILTAGPVAADHSAQPQMQD